MFTCDILISNDKKTQKERIMVNGEIKTIMTFIGSVEIHKISDDCYKASTTRGHHMAKATEAKVALESLLNGVCYALTVETLNSTNLK